jgi:hypothetical protein
MNKTDAYDNNWFGRVRKVPSETARTEAIKKAPVSMGGAF